MPVFFSDKQHLNKTNSYNRRTQLTDLNFSFQGTIINIYLKGKKKNNLQLQSIFFQGS
jgi:hypothetical protein